MNDVLFRWLIGLVGVSTVLGVFISLFWYWALKKIDGIIYKKVKCKTLLTEYGILTGIVERAFFTVAIATCMSGGIITAMVAWTALKSQTLWAAFSVAVARVAVADDNKTNNEKKDKDIFVSLLASLGSMIIAIVAGNICSGAILKDYIDALLTYIVAL